MKIDTSQDPIYNFRGNTNRSGQQYQGYRNNHSRYGGVDNGVGPGGFQAMPQLGQRRNYNEFAQGQIVNFDQQDQ